MPGRASAAAKKRFGARTSAYEAIKSGGMSKSAAAAIANAGRTKAGRSRMAKKAAATRRKR